MKPLSALAMLLAAALLSSCAPSPPSPNVLLVVADDWSADHAGSYGCRWVKTPNFDRIASRGLLFENAFTPVAKCAPSRAALLTGRNPWQLGAAANHACFFPMEFTSLFEAFSKQGWSAGFTGKGWSPGVALDRRGRPRNLTGRSFQKRSLKAPTSGIDGNDYAGNLSDFLDQAAPGRPWIFWMGIHEPHRGYERGSGIAKGGKRLSDPDRVPSYWPDTRTVRSDMLDYAMEVEHFDAQLGRAVRELEKRGQLDNTLVVITSDNGMPFPRVKGQTFLHSNRMPLAIMWPAGLSQPGRRVREFVSFVDIAPTVAGLAGIPWWRLGMAAPAGRSLEDIIRASPPASGPARDHVLLGKERNDPGRPGDAGYPSRGIVSNGMLYVRNYAPERWPSCNPETGYLDTDGGPTKSAILQARRAEGSNRHWTACFGKRPAEELYDLQRDPDCMRNLASEPALRETKEGMERDMVAELRSQGDPRMFGRGSALEKHPFALEKFRNFHERHMKGEQLRPGWVSPTDFESGPLD